MKGPADYSNDGLTRKIPGQYHTNQPIGQLMNETDFLSKQAPGSNFYNPNFDVSSRAARIPRCNMNRDRSPKSPMVPF